MLQISGAIFVSCLMIHIQFVIYSDWFVDLTTYVEDFWLNVAKTLAFLAYPIGGWIAEVYTTRAKMIKWSFVVNFFGIALMVVTGVLIMFPIERNYGHYPSLFVLIAMITSLTCAGMYEANVIQFGMVEMVEASSDQLSSFVHWYFWYSHLGNIVIYYLMYGFVLYSISCGISIQGLPTKSKIQNQTNLLYGAFILIIIGVQTLAAISGIIFVTCSKLFRNKQPKQNSIQLIFQVLKYSYHHKYPVRRSAFTYWENEIPSRIDFGKNKYGGSFTYEQVEDVKTFFRLLLLILSLFGVHLLGDGFSLTQYIMKTFRCPNKVSMFIVMANPQHITLLVIIVGVPLIRWLQTTYFKRFSFNMLSKIQLGLTIALVAQATTVLYTLLLKQAKTNCPEELYYGTDGTPPIKHCTLVNTKIVYNSTCHHFCSDTLITEDNDIHMYLAAIPLALQGVSYLLVFMTMLEFICAQAPNSMKGLLIGLWYSTLSIKCVTNIMDKQPMLLATTPWCVYNGIKGVGIFLSILLSSRVIKRYRYREKNEIGYQQNNTEELVIRELEREEQSLTQSVDSNNTLHVYEIN